MYSGKTLKQLHQVEQEILDEIVRICDKNKIPYYLCGGTLLGAVRHKGFIPWDDDIDIAMLREDYNKFREIASKELNEKYVLDCYQTNPNCYFPFLKVRKNNTLLDEELVSHLNFNKGIYVDIFPLERVLKPYSKKLRIEAMLIKNIWETILYKYKIIKNIQECRHPKLVRILSMYRLPTLKKLQMHLLEKQNNPKATTITSLIGAYDYRKEFYEEKKLIPGKPILFEGKEYMGFQDVDYYLSRLYGDYRKLPPEDQRVNHSAKKVVFDLEKENIE